MREPLCIKIANYKRPLFPGIGGHGQLLAVVCYRKGALSIKNTLAKLYSEETNESYYARTTEEWLLFVCEEVDGRTGETASFY